MSRWIDGRMDRWMDASNVRVWENLQRTGGIQMQMLIEALHDPHLRNESEVYLAIWLLRCSFLGRMASIP